MAFLPGLQQVVSGEFWGKDDRKRAEDKLAESSAVWDQIKPSDIGPIELENYNWQGDLTAPEMVAPGAVQYGDIQSELNNLDPRLRDAQLAALASLQQVSDKGGMMSQDVANLNRIQTDVAQADKGRRDAITQGMARRGMGGSGMELLAQLQSSQAATDRASQAGLDIAGTAQQRALQALMQSGELAGGVRSQDANVASAKDAITKFNASNRLQNDQYNTNMQFDTTKLNTGRQFEANQANWQGKQSLANKNVDTRNKQTTTNSIDIPQQNLDNQTTWARGKTQQLGGEAAYRTQRAGAQAEAGKAAFQGAAKGGKAVMDYYNAPDEEEQK